LLALARFWNVPGIGCCTERLWSNRKSLLETLLHYINQRIIITTNPNTPLAPQPPKYPVPMTSRSRHGHEFRTLDTLTEQRRKEAKHTKTLEDFHRLLSIPMIPPVLPCMLPVTLSRRPLRLSAWGVELPLFLRVLFLRSLRASCSSSASSARTRTPPFFLSSNTCCLDAAAC